MFKLLNLFLILSKINAECVNLNYKVNLENVTNEYYDYFKSTSTGPVTFFTNTTPCNSKLDQISLQSNSNNGELVYGINNIYLNEEVEITNSIPTNIEFRLNLYIDKPGKQCNSTDFNGTLCYPTNSPIKDNNNHIQKNNANIILYTPILSFIFIIINYY
jgi:hypothetical protein